MTGKSEQSEFKRFTAPGIELILREDCAQRLLDLDVGHPENLAGPSDASVMQGRGAIICVGLPDRPGERIVIRHYRHGGLLRRLTGDLFFGRGRFIRELELTRMAAEHGVPTLDVVGLAMRRVLPGIWRGDFITLEIPDAVDLTRYLLLAPSSGRCRVTSAAARAVRAMHDAGIMHADLNLKNILVAPRNDGEPRAFIIDLDKSRHLGTLSLGERIWNLARLNRSAQKLNRRRPVVTRADRLRFFRSYAGDEPAMKEIFVNRIFDARVHRGWWRFLDLLRGSDDLGMAGAGRILVKGANWLGDAVMTLPAIRALRRALPRARISVVTPAGLKGLYAGMQEVNFVMDYATEADLLKMAPTLRRWKIDAAIIFPRSFRSALLPFLARIPLRVGYGNGLRNLLLTRRLERSRAALSRHRVYYFADVVQSLGISVEEEIHRPWIEPGPAARRRAAELLAPLGGAGGPRVAIHPGATYGGAKQWMPERFVEVARRLVEENGARIVMLGAGSAEIKLASRIADEIREAVGAYEAVVSLAGRTTVMELAAVLSECDFLITNDTGPMHVAAAVGTPVVAVFGPTDPVTTHPFGPGHVVIREEVECSPCLKRECPTDHRCMTRIDVDRVYKAAVEKWAAVCSVKSGGTTDLGARGEGAA